MADVNAAALSMRRIVYNIAAFKYNAVSAGPAVYTAAAGCRIVRNRAAGHVEPAAANRVILAQDGRCNAAAHAVGLVAGNRAVCHFKRCVVLYEDTAAACIRQLNCIGIDCCAVAGNRTAGHGERAVLTHAYTAAALCRVVGNRAAAHGKRRSAVYEYAACRVILRCGIARNRAVGHRHGAVCEGNRAGILVLEHTSGDFAAVHGKFAAVLHINRAAVCGGRSGNAAELAVPHGEGAAVHRNRTHVRAAQAHTSDRAAVQRHCAVYLGKRAVSDAEAGEIEAAVQNQRRVWLHAESWTGEAILEHNRKALAFIGQRDGLAGRNRNRAVYNEALVCGNGGVSLCCHVNGLLQRAFFAFADICAIDSDRKLYSNTGRNRQRIRIDRNICRACFNIEVGDIGIFVKCLSADGLQLAFALALFANLHGSQLGAGAECTGRDGLYAVGKLQLFDTGVRKRCRTDGNNPFRDDQRAGRIRAAVKCVAANIFQRTRERNTADGSAAKCIGTQKSQRIRQSQIALNLDIHKCLIANRSNRIRQL